MSSGDTRNPPPPMANTVRRRRLGPGAALAAIVLGTTLCALSGGLLRSGFAMSESTTAVVPIGVLALGLLTVGMGGALLLRALVDEGMALSWSIGGLGLAFLGVPLGWLIVDLGAEDSASGGPWVPLIIGLVLVAMATLMLLIGYRRHRVRRRTERDGRRTQGTVTRVRRVGHRGESQRLEVTVRFIDQHGAIHSTTSTTDDLVLHPGESVPVVYDPQRPGRREAVLLDL